MKKRSAVSDGWREKNSGANKLDLRNEIQEQHSERGKPWFNWVFEALDLPAHGEVLDLGGGTGSLWAENSGEIPRGCRVVLTDASLDMLRTARAEKRLPARSRILSAGIQGIPFAAERFDVVTAVGLLDLVPNLHAALTEVHRVLKPGGLFLATAGGKGHLQELEALLLPYLPKDQARSIGGVEDQFGMENGEASIGAVFRDVNRREFLDRMLFRETQPVLKYLLSEHAVSSALSLEQFGDLIGQLKRRLDKHGVFSVTIHKGLFTARKG